RPRPGRPDVAMVGRPARHRLRPGPDLARLPAPLRRRARIPVRQDHPRLDLRPGAHPPPGRPVDLADHRRLHPAAPGPAPPPPRATPPPTPATADPAAASRLAARHPPPQTATPPPGRNPPRPAPGRPKGSTPGPAPRYPVLKKDQPAPAAKAPGG